VPTCWIVPGALIEALICGYAAHHGVTPHDRYQPLGGVDAFCSCSAAVPGPITVFMRAPAFRDVPIA